MNKRTVYLVLTAVFTIAFILSTGLTLASWAVESNTVNQIALAVVRGRIIVDFEEGQTLYPASIANKVVEVQNLGTVDSAVRVKVEKFWGNERDMDGKLIVNPDLSTDNIVIEYNNEDWLYSDEDGYYYYKGVLAPEDYTSALYSKFKIDADTTCSEYRNKQADITVTMEMTQAAGNGLSFWNMNFDKLGIDYAQSVEIPIATAVKFKSPSDGFKYVADEGNLFAAFDNLVPGESRSQVIKITNEWDESAEFFLWADSFEQSQISGATYELIDKLLRIYATVVITDENGNLIYSGPVWGDSSSISQDVYSMKHPIGLGVFKSGETKTFNVCISLNEQLGNDYRGILGKIKWCFSAKGDSGSNSSDSTSSEGSHNSYGDFITTTPVKTGYGSSTVIYAGIMILSATALCISVLLRRKKERS